MFLLVLNDFCIKLTGRDLCGAIENCFAAAVQGNRCILLGEECRGQIESDTVQNPHTAVETSGTFETHTKTHFC